VVAEDSTEDPAPVARETEVVINTKKNLKQFSLQIPAGFFYSFHMQKLISS
jgi:hypothetical protein